MCVCMRVCVGCLFGVCFVLVKCELCVFRVWECVFRVWVLGGVSCLGVGWCVWVVVVYMDMYVCVCLEFYISKLQC